MTDASAPAAAMPKHQSSQAAIDLIVTEEDSGQAYYTKHYDHFEWPALPGHGRYRLRLRLRHARSDPERLVRHHARRHGCGIGARRGLEGRLGGGLRPRPLRRRHHHLGLGDGGIHQLLSFRKEDVDARDVCAKTRFALWRGHDDR